MWLLGQAVKTSPFHGGNTGSIPVGVIYLCADVAHFVLIARKGNKRQSRLITNQLIIVDADVAQLAEQLICNQQVIGSSPIIGFVPKREHHLCGPLAQLVRAIGS